MNKTTLRLLAVAAGYLASFTVAGALVALRYLWADPADVDASSGMWAFGDVLWTLILGGLGSVVPTWLLLRTVSAYPRLMRALAWAGLTWSALAPPSALLLFFGPLLGALPLHALALLRTMLMPGSVALFTLAAWLLRAEDTARGPLRLAVSFELLGLLGAGLWLLYAVQDGCRG